VHFELFEHFIGEPISRDQDIDPIIRFESFKVRFENFIVKLFLVLVIHNTKVVLESNSFYFSGVFLDLNVVFHLGEVLMVLEND